MHEKSRNKQQTFLNIKQHNNRMSMEGMTLKGRSVIKGKKCGAVRMSHQFTYHPILITIRYFR